MIKGFDRVKDLRAVVLSLRLVSGSGSPKALAPCNKVFTRIRV